jgi:pyruvate dehydrogenase E2 component (dihydrolipoamide acetyltransferase)
MVRVAEMRAAMAEMGDEFKVSFNDIILKAVATALAQHPECNAHWLGDGIRSWHRVHIGMAVAIDEGLITPVIFDAHLKGLSEIGAESRDLAKRARERRPAGGVHGLDVLRLQPRDVWHRSATAIINRRSRHSAIGGIEPRRSLSVESHRAAPPPCDDGCDHQYRWATGARFLQTLRRLLENPLMLVYSALSPPARIWLGEL